MNSHPSKIATDAGASLLRSLTKIKSPSGMGQAPDVDLTVTCSQQEVFVLLHK